MTGMVESPRLALLVRSRPHTSRETRAQPDLALAAAALDYRLEVYFLGGAVLQLARERDSAAAMLPPGYRAWAAVGELSEARFFGEAAYVQRLEEQGIGLLVPVDGLPPAVMSRRWRDCDHVVAL